jgi:hypothetical protein
MAKPSTSVIAQTKSHRDQIGAIRHRRGKDIRIILQGKGGDERLVGLVIKKAHHDHDGDWQGKKPDKHRREWGHL